MRKLGHLRGDWFISHHNEMNENYLDEWIQLWQGHE